MSQKVVISLGVADIERAKHFYSEGLGWPIEWDHGKFVSLGLGNGSPGLALYTGEALAFDAGLAVRGGGYRGVTLSCIVDAAERVDDVMARVARAGAEVLKPAHTAPWGGYLGYFADPDGNLWKVVVRMG
jgi:catechol 2,3-dioxygenase-like lactoylglutathione lyase family enzyme